ncbi:MAG: response regulator, partial [Candidatus Binatia bacterium]
DHPISVRSWPGRGTVFTVDVPLSRAQVVAPVTRGPAVRAAGSLNNAVVLCIDNEASILEGMTALLSGWSCRVVLATSADEARMAFEQDPDIDLILADYHLNEGADGITVANELRARWGADIPGIVISADHTAYVREQAQECGYLFLQKPIKPAALRAMMSKLLTQYAKAG